MSLCVDDRLVCRFGWIQPPYQKVIYTDWHIPDGIQTCIPEGHLHRLTYTRWDPNLHTRRSTQTDIYQMGSKPPYQTVIYTDWHIPDRIQTCIREGHLHRLIYTRWDPNLHNRRSSAQIDIYQMGSKPPYQTVIYTDWHIPDGIESCIPEGHLHRLIYTGSKPAYQKVIYTDWYIPDGIQTCIPEGHLHRLTYTRRRTDTINAPDDGHIADQNM